MTKFEGRSDSRAHRSMKYVASDDDILVRMEYYCITPTYNYDGLRSV